MRAVQLRLWPAPSTSCMPVFVARSQSSRELVCVAAKIPTLQQRPTAELRHLTACAISPARHTSSWWFVITVHPRLLLCFAFNSLPPPAPPPPYRTSCPPLCPRTCSRQRRLTPVIIQARYVCFLWSPTIGEVLALCGESLVPRSLWIPCGAVAIASDAYISAMGRSRASVGVTLPLLFAYLPHAPLVRRWHG